MRKYFTLLFAFVLVAGLTIASGVIQGRMTQRWGEKPDVLAAADLLKRIPEEFGDWRTVDTLEMGEGVTRMLQCSGHVTRAYENRRTGARVSAAVLLGPSGPMAAHTPEICYSSTDYTQQEDRQTVDIGDTDDQFWMVQMQRNSVDGQELRVLYAWNDGEHWKAAHQPRWEFAERPFLYKIQLAAVIPAKSEQSETDPCRDFLEDFLPAIEPFVVHAQ